MFENIVKKEEIALKNDQVSLTPQCFHLYQLINSLVKEIFSIFAEVMLKSSDSDLFCLGNGLATTFLSLFLLCFFRHIYSPNFTFCVHIYNKNNVHILKVAVSWLVQSTNVFYSSRVWSFGVLLTLVTVSARSSLSVYICIDRNPYCDKILEVKPY